MADSVKVKITGDTSDFEKALKQLGQKTEDAAKKNSTSAGTIFKGLMASQIVTKGISLLTNGLKSAINTGMQFEAAMSQVAAISGATEQELELLTETAKRYGETTMFSASQAAEALNYMALAGWDAQQSTDALGGVLDLAAASGMDLGAASDAVTDYLSAFSMEASQAGYMADMMAYAQSRSNTTATMLADAYGNCASSMHAAGQDIETTTAMLMALANQGIKGSEAGTQMAAVMRDLTQKMDHGQIMIGKTAVSVTDAAGNFRDLNDIMQDVGKATEGMGTAEKSAALMETFTARSVKAVNTLLNEGIESVNAYEDALRGSTGTAAEQASTMMDNLQGDVKIFQSALEGVQITASESTNGIARSLVQEATGILEAVNQAGKTGGISGMADALIGQIPSLLPKVTKGAQTLLGGLGKRLPGLVKGLFASMPDVLGSAVGLVPQLVESLSEAASSAIESLIAGLPRLVPMLASAFGNLFVSAFKGMGSLLDSAFIGLDDAVRDAGGRKLRLDEVLQKKIDEVSPDYKKKLSGSLEADYKIEPVTIDVEAFSAELEGAIKTIRDAVDGISDLDEETKAKLKTAILSGSGADAVTAALTSLNIPEEKITEVQTSLTTAFDSINATLSGLNLNDGQVDSLLDSLGKGEDIQAKLESFGVDPETAAQVAADLQTSMANLDEGLSGLDIDSSQVVGFLGEASADKALIALALAALKVDEGKVAEVANSYDALEGTLAGKISGAFEALKRSLTNGIPDKNDPAFATAKQQVQDFFDEAYAVVDEWEAGKKKELEESGLTGTELETKLQAIETEAQSMRDQISGLGEATTEWVEANAGAAGSVVRQHFDELEALIAQVYGIDAKVKELQGSMSNGGAINRRAVEQGLVSDQQGQLEAINYSSQELDHALQAARDEAAQALEKAASDFAGDTEGYAAERERIMAQLAEKEGEAYGNYDDHMQKIVASMLKNSPEIAAAIEQYQQKQDLAETGQKLVDGMNEAIHQAVTEGTDPAEWFKNNAGLTDADYTAIAEELGIEPSALQNAINEAFASGDTSGLLSMDGFRDLLNPEQSLADAFAGMDMSSVMATLGTALDEGLLQAGGDVDWTNIAAVIQTGMDGVGSGITDGLTTGMSDTSGVESAGKTMGTAAVDAVADGAQTHSPSAATMAVGDGVVEGLATGMSNTSSVTAAAKNLGDAAIDGVGDKSADMQSAGRNFAQGLANGIGSSSAIVAAAARAVAQAAVQAAKNALGIASPSRVMMEVGGYAGEGFSIGLQDSLQSAMRSARTVVGLANLSPKADFSGITGAMQGMEDLMGAENERTTNLYIDGKRMATTTAPSYNSALNSYAQRITLGYGRG